MSGVTSRTLRHYGQIGLLRPAGVRANGYRHYGRQELLRLQQILVLRELGLGRNETAAVLDRQRDRVQALREHHRRLLTERDRLADTAKTVARTIAELEAHDGDQPMINRPENLFEGFEPSEYDAEARARWPEQWEQAQRSPSPSPRRTSNGCGWSRPRR
jgi:DNA-binding transcriptional MerR regulator